MPARRLSLTNKKVRGVSRRLRALSRWAESFAEYFPAGLSAEERYWNVKIPVLSSLIQGRQTSREIQTYCAQQLIFAAHNIFRAKPEDMTNVRVTCCVIRPDMFASELCIFTDDDYFNEHTSNGRSHFGMLEKIQDQSLAKTWGLKIPEGFSEIGILRTAEDDDGNPYVSEYWYFGEVSKHG